MAARDQDGGVSTTFLFGTWPGRIILVIGGIITIIVVSGGVLGVLAISGGPADCTPGGGPIKVSDAMSDRFQQKWDQFDEALDAGSPSSVTFSESEVTSRAVNWINNEGGPDFDDAQVCLHDAYAEATGTLNGWAFFDVKFLLRGTLRVTGGHVNVVISDVEIGNLPDPLTGSIEGMVEDPLDESLGEFEVEPHTYTVILTEGSVTVEGQP